MLTDTLDELLDLCERRPTRAVTVVDDTAARRRLQADTLTPRGWVHVGLESFVLGRSTLRVLLATNTLGLAGVAIDRAYVPPTVEPSLRREISRRLLATVSEHHAEGTP